MSILINPRNEQEEKTILDFLDSLAVEYSTEVGPEQMSAKYIQKYNQLLDTAESEIEAGNFASQRDVESIFEKRRQSI